MEYTVLDVRAAGKLPSAPCWGARQSPLANFPIEMPPRLGDLIRRHLTRPGRSRHAAMFAIAGQVPAPVLAELIGIADKTATKWVSLATRDWSEYVTQRDTYIENG